MNIKERAAAVLQQIEQRRAFALDDEQTALRCLKLAIEGLLAKRDETYQIRAVTDPLLTTICDQWEAQP